jgi:hypothetical protein
VPLTENIRVSMRKLGAGMADFAWDAVAGVADEVTAPIAVTAENKAIWWAFSRWAQAGFDYVDGYMMNLTEPSVTPIRPPLHP